MVERGDKPGCLSLAKQPDTRGITMKNTQINLRGARRCPRSCLRVRSSLCQQWRRTSSSSTAKSTTTAEQDDQGGQIVVTGSLLRAYRHGDSVACAGAVVRDAGTARHQHGCRSGAASVGERFGARSRRAGTTAATSRPARTLSRSARLTVQSTLTIFDGLRMAPYPLADDGHRNFVDLNTIPAAIVDRIEVLKDGASSTYGADAIAGVVNVIMKKEVTGIHLNASAGISDRGDGAEQRIDATVGYGSLD